MTEQLILLPGFANNEQVWQHQIESLGDLCNIHVYIMDKETTRDEMVDALLEKAPSRFMLAGHSMGGWIAQALAAKAPDRVAKLLLLNTWATSDPKIISLFQQVCKAIKLGQLQEAMQMQLPLLVHPSRHEDPALMQDLQTMITSFPLDVLIQQLEAMINDHSSLHHHPAITSPTLVMHSKDDALFPHEHQPLLDGIENSRLALIENCGHASTMEQPKVVSECMRSFIVE